MKTILLCASGALLATALTGSAAVINMTVAADGTYLQNGITDPNLSLASNAFYESFVGSTANSKASNLLFLQGVIGNWNDNSLTPPMPLVADASSQPADNDNIGDTSTFTASAGYDYVVFHFGNGQAGDRNIRDETGWWIAWYLGGEATIFNLLQEGAPPQDVGGFSSARYFNGSAPPNPHDVPDGGTTLVLLGSALTGLGLLRRKFGLMID